MADAVTGRFVLLLSSALFLAACEEGQKPKFFDKPIFQKKTTEATEDGAVATPAVKATVVEKDVEVPEVFHKVEDGLWDGRPSLGGIWIAHSDVTDPERVVIRNVKNGKSVIGALFRRERENPGPRLQVSSDAASALGMLAGAPVKLDVVALRRQEVVIEPAIGAVAETAEKTAKAVKPAAGATSKKVETVAATAAAAITAAEIQAGTAIKTTKLDGTKAVGAAKPTSSLKKPYIQIGIYSIESNANDTVSELRLTNITASTKRLTSNGKTFWRVIVGPAETRVERTRLLKKIKSLGFTDAYNVAG